MRVSIQLPNRAIVVSSIVLGTAAALSSLAVVRAERMQPNKSKTFSCSSGYACLQAKSSGSSTIGLFAAVNGGSNNEAVYGQADLGVGVLGNAANGYGVTGEGALAGVFGEATNVGTSAAPGIYGYTTTAGAGAVGANAGGAGPGVYGVSSSGYGVQAYSASLAAFYGESAGSGGTVLTGQADASSTYLFYLVNASTGKYCQADPYANMYCSGSFTSGGALGVRHRSAGGQHVVAYASQSASATIEDAGEARMFNGVANVMIPSDFAAVIDRSSDYYVFLTPLGDTRGLYVNMKTASGFQVRENERGRTNVAFDYRILARPVDADADRLPLAPRMKRLQLSPQRPQLPPLPKLAH